MVFKDEEEAKKLEEDPFYRLEHKNEDIRKAKEAAPALVRLQDMRQDWEDDFGFNQTLRRQFRVQD